MYKCNIKGIAKEKGFMHCTKLNYLLRFILVKSSKFKDEEIEQKLSWCGFIFPHQYLKIKIGKNKSVYVDLWGKRYGTKFGSYVKNVPKKL